MFNKLFRTSFGISRLIGLIIFSMNLTPAQAILVEWDDGSSFEPGTTLVARLCNYEIISEIPHDCSKDPYVNLGMDTPTIVSDRMTQIGIENKKVGDDFLRGFLAKNKSGEDALYIAVGVSTPTSAAPIWYSNSEEMTADSTIVQEWLNEVKVVKLTKPTTRK
ncbi:MAG: hypothetical protein K2Q34_06275 [Alphaproteobacteria bacterium]|nr:hypothetical protein [Alphaproteobacteria bacterium]